MVTRNTLPPIRRYITTHTKDGEAVFLSPNQIPECVPSRPAGDDGDLALLYATATFPVQAHDEADVAIYDDYLHTPPGLTAPTGTVMRVIDMKPGKITPMHRTVSLDYGVVIEGEAELILDSGEKRVMKRGDVSIQRGTSHSFRNTSDSEWCRLLFVFLPMEQLTVAGKQLGEEWYEEQYDSGSESQGQGGEPESKER